VAVERLRLLSHQDVLGTPVMATSDKMDVLAGRRQRLFLNEIFQKENGSLSSVSTRREFQWAYKKCHYSWEEEEYVFTLCTTSPSNARLVSSFQQVCP